MVSFALTSYREKILHRLETRFGTFFLCLDVVVSELNEGILFGPNEAREVMEPILSFYERMGMVQKRVYIANRINDYAVQPLGWLKFQDIKQHLVGYCVVTQTRNGLMSALLESKFVPVNFKSVKSLDKAMLWAQSQLHKLGDDSGVK